MTLLTLITVAVLLTGAAMLVAGIGAAGLWIAVITIGIVLVFIDRIRRGHGHRSA